MEVCVTINGAERSADLEPRTLLVHFLRDHLDLTGTNVGCDTASCGACTIHVDGRSVKSCTVLAVQVEGADITTIEGLAAADGTLHPMQQAFHEFHALQCVELHARDGHGGGLAGGRVSQPVRTPGPPWPRGQSLSMYGIPQHREGRALGGRCVMTTIDEATAPGIGDRMLRKEDAKLLTGEAKFVDDIKAPGELWMGMVRSTLAHARIVSIDSTAAIAMDGVFAVYTGAQLQDMELWAAPLPCAWPVTEDMVNPPHHPVAVEEAKHVGDIVAVVLAESRY
jgi:hypothetical protein